MQTIDTLIIGGGQAGLATSHELTALGRDHVVLERGEIAERWRRERPSTLRLLTPNWMTRLPGWPYRGNDPDGFMTAPQLAAHLDQWAISFGAPVQDRTAVSAVTPTGDGDYEVRTDQGTWRAANVVVATGHAQQPAVPALASGLAERIHQIVPTTYRGPADLPPGGVLVVGASSTGLQIAEDAARAGRRVVLAVGAHNRLVRSYRGMDSMWWLDRMGLFDLDVDELGDLEQARRQPSWQLVGRPGGGDLDLVTAREAGVELAGRVIGVAGEMVRFADDLTATTQSADLRLERLLDRVDSHILLTGLRLEVDAPDRPRPVAARPGPDRLHLGRAGIASVVWATGYRRSYPWLHVPVLDPRGEIVQRRGVTASPGLYTVGLRLQTHRSSNFLAGVGYDAAEVAARIAAAAAPATGRATTGGDR